MARYTRCIVLFLALLCTISCLSACSKGEKEEAESIIYYTVTFNSNGGSSIESKQVEAEKTLSEPQPPTREGYIFDGWKAENGLLWDFPNDLVTKDIQLTAVWLPTTEMFLYEKISDTEVMITGLKQLRATIPVPSLLAGYSVVAIDDGVFYDMDSLDVQTITLPHTLTSVGEEAFFGCSGISIVIDERAVLTKIGTGAFFGCDKLSAIRLGEGLTVIAADTFFGCSSLTEIRLPQSVVALEDNAFADCSSLVTVMLYPQLTQIGDSAFKDCDALKAIYFYGSAEQLTALREHGTSNQNNSFYRATPYYYSETQPPSQGNYWFLNQHNRPQLW